MDSSLTNDTKAIILLCGILGKDRATKPLTQNEYSALVRWLIQEKMRPADLLQPNLDDSAATNTGIELERLKFLLGRGVQLGFAVEEWQRNGIWIISRSDKDYPVRYKRHLKEKAPPLLFGIGDRNLLRGGGLAIVGSRNVDAHGEAFARQTAEWCVHNQQIVVSGGAPGVDQIAMTTVIDAGGTSIGILAENLMQKSLERQSRHAIVKKQLLLISPYPPNAPFNVDNAMARNKLIYALSDFGLVVSADHKTGGTWAGAEEEMNRDPSIPIFVRSGESAPSGNKKLIELGAMGWPEGIDTQNMTQKLIDLASQNKKSGLPKNMSLFDEPSSTVTADPVYDAVLPLIMDKLQRPITADELSKALHIQKPQLNHWLNKAVAEGKVQKLPRPVRFCILDKV